MKINRLLYFLYYLKETNRKKFNKFFSEVKEKKQIPAHRILFDIIHACFKYNISILDYFYFRFFELSSEQRELYVGTGYMYEYQLKMNPKGPRRYLQDKILFLHKYSAFIKRSYADISTLKNNFKTAEDILSNKSDKIVLKASKGQIGSQVQVFACSDLTPHKLLQVMDKNDFDLAEEFVVQHPSLMELSPSGLNTIRIITQIHNGNVEFLGARLRISVNSQVDNMAAGNLAAPVDVQKGVVTGPGVYSDITKQDEIIHPSTGIKIKDFKIPFWENVTELARNAALLLPQNRSVGWDIGITNDGPELIEGNHNWCKLLWQLPVKSGLKPELKKYL